MKWPGWLRKRPELRAPTVDPLDVPIDADASSVDELLANGREQSAIELLRNLVAAHPQDHALALRLAELLCGRLEHTAARPLLERLVIWPAQRERALVLLAEEAERAGDLDRARTTWERLLAYDIDHVRARSAMAQRRPMATRLTPLPTMAPATPAVAIGGRYRLRGELGRGASGTVYRADDIAVAREVALKILHPGARDARAWQEARISAALQHPGAAAIFDLDEERQLISMELCAGGSLRDRLHKGPLPALDAIRALAQLLDVLSAAHALGIVHGDVKPANLLLRHAPSGPLHDDELVLCDFGVARRIEETAQREARGTLVYMAPEQRRGVHGAAADVYATGVVALELCGGHEALAAALGDRAALLRGELMLDPVLPANVAAALGARAPSLQALLAALLSANAAHRPPAADAAHAARALLAMV